MNFQPVDILLVEDSPADAEMTLRTLKRRGIANNIEWVKDGVEALEFLTCTGAFSERRNGVPKLVLLDLKLPRMDGLQVLDKIRQDPATKHIPVVMMTSSREDGDLLASYERGVNSFVVKPVDFADFAETVSKIGIYWILANQAPS